MTATATGSWLGPGGADLERLLADDAVGAELQSEPRTATIRVVVTWRVGGRRSAMGQCRDASFGDGRCRPSEAELVVPRRGRVGTLGTVDRDGRPRLVPICFAFDAADVPLRIWSPLDEKPKRVIDPRDLGAFATSRQPAVSLLVDAWSEDWSALGWLRLDGLAGLIEPTGRRIGGARGGGRRAPGEVSAVRRATGSRIARSSESSSSGTAAGAIWEGVPTS